MFASLVDALQGPAEQAVDDSASDEDIQGPAEGLQAAPQQSESAAQEPEVLISSPSAPEEETPAAAAASGLQSVDDLAEEDPQIPVTQPEASRTSVPTAAAQRPQQAFSLWGMASALADNVRKNTADIASRCASARHYTGAGDCRCCPVWASDMLRICVELWMEPAVQRCVCNVHGVPL